MMRGASGCYTYPGRSYSRDYAEVSASSGALQLSYGGSVAYEGDTFTLTQPKVPTGFNSTHFIDRMSLWRTMAFVASVKLKDSCTLGALEDVLGNPPTVRTILRESARRKAVEEVLVRDEVELTFNYAGGGVLSPARAEALSKISKCSTGALEECESILSTLEGAFSDVTDAAPAPASGVAFDSKDGWMPEPNHIVKR